MMYCHERKPPEEHAWTPQIHDDGDANVWKCGRCGMVVAWDVGDYAEAYVAGDKLQRPRCEICGRFLARVCDAYTLEPLGYRCVALRPIGDGQWEHVDA